MNNKSEDQNIFEKAKAIYMDRALLIAACDKKLKKLMERASLKLEEISSNPAIAQVKFQVEVFFRMIKAHKNKKYTGLSNRSIGLMVLGLFYFALPLDFVPDFIPFVGYVDDITVLLAVFKSLQADIANFLQWEKSQV